MFTNSRLDDNRTINVQRRAKKDDVIEPTMSTDQTMVNILKNIDKNINNLYRSAKKRTNYHSNYYIDTSNTNRLKIDILKTTGDIANELTVLDNGGGFSFEINDEGYRIDSVLNLQLLDEDISKIYVIGSGIPGTARIRIGGFK